MGIWNRLTNPRGEMVGAIERDQPKKAQVSMPRVYEDRKNVVEVGGVLGGSGQREEIEGICNC